ncbi:hypothetical protein CXG81DRAFT_2446, partial [Caulochytrium protostelioides]
PIDTVSALAFDPDDDGSTLLATSWDGVARLYDGRRGTLLHASASVSGTPLVPLLSGCYVTGGRGILLGGLDGQVRCWQPSSTPSVASSSSTPLAVLGTHAAAVSALAFATETSLAISGSWDGTCAFWDVRRANLSSSASACVHRFSVSGKVFALDVRGETMLLGLSNRMMAAYDVRRPGRLLWQMASPLKYMTRSLALAPDDSGTFVLGSIEGRVAMDSVVRAPAAAAANTPSPSPPLRYAFKCHRELTDVATRIHSIEALAFHPTYGTFASGGTDGMVNVWDGRQRKRIRQLPRVPAGGITSMAFSGAGDRLAIAA